MATTHGPSWAVADRGDRLPGSERDPEVFGLHRGVRPPDSCLVRRVVQHLGFHRGRDLATNEIFEHLRLRRLSPLDPPSYAARLLKTKERWTMIPPPMLSPTIAISRRVVSRAV